MPCSEDLTNYQVSDRWNFNPVTALLRLDEHADDIQTTQCMVPEELSYV